MKKSPTIFQYITVFHKKLPYHYIVFYVYILYSKSHDRYYIGQTNNLDKRLERHNKGYVKSTKPYKPWIIFYSEELNSRSESMKRETYLKSMKSKTFIKELLNTSR